MENKENGNYYNGFRVWVGYCPHSVGVGTDSQREYLVCVVFSILGSLWTVTGCGLYPRPI